MIKSFRSASFVMSFAFSVASACFGQQQQWIAPTPEELSMTSIPEVPGATAVYLYREETADDSLRMHTSYVRLKVLTEGGKDYANVELPYVNDAGVKIDSIAGRTIHPDGTIIPFTGKPYDKLVAKIQGFQEKEKIFTLPDVAAGSIIEYRYKLHYDDAYFIHPDWFIQSDLFTRKAHYSWKPTDELVDLGHGDISSTVAWSPILPEGVTVKQTRGPNGGNLLQLDVTDIPPLPKEEYMPPIGSLSYRVQFYYTSYKTPNEYWQKQGGYWSKDRDKFIGPGKGVKTAVAGLVAPTDTPDQKLRKIYAFIMTLENTDFTREHTEREEHAQGLKEATIAEDILAHKRGSGDQLTQLFVSMARAAGMKAYLAGVADRSQRIFRAGYLSFSQIDDYLAIVNVDGKEITFDPGRRYCVYGHVAWQHDLTSGLRQTDNGTELFNTPGSSYKDSRTGRIADLMLDEQGSVTGPVTLSFTGNPALHWREEALKGDETSLNEALKENLEQMLPGGMEVHVTKVENIADPDKDLKVTYDVKGAVGSPTGKRLLVQGNLFEINSKPKFPSAKREVAVDMHYPSLVQDAVRFKMPATIAIESAPTDEKDEMKGAAAFNTTSKKGNNSITLYRNLTIGRALFGAADYPELKTFYGKVEAKDQETLVLTHAAAASSTSGAF